MASSEPEPEIRIANFSAASERAVVSELVAMGVRADLITTE